MTSTISIMPTETKIIALLSNISELLLLQGVPKTCSQLCGYCGGAVVSIILVFKQLHGSGFNLDFESLLLSIRQVVADLEERQNKWLLQKQQIYCSPAMPK